MAASSLALPALPAGAIVAPTITINEVLANTSGTDVEFLEVIGTPCAVIDHLSLVSVEGDAGASQGTVDKRLDLPAGTRLGANGYLLIGNALTGSTYGVTPDVSLPNDFFENSTHTNALVETASAPTVGSVLTGGETAVDSVALTDGGEGDAAFYGAPVVGPDGPYLPGGAKLVVEGQDTDQASDWTLTPYSPQPNTESTPTARTLCEGETPPPAPSYPIVVNEFLADPAGDLTGDANGDGTRDSGDDEFVELVNISDATIDLSSATISDGFSERHVFAAGTVLRPGCAIVVFGGGTTPTALGGSDVVTASTGSLSLNNGGDTITVAADGETLATTTYGSEASIDESLVLAPEVSGEAYVAHSVADTADSSLFSPGTKADTSTFCDATTIEDVQGTGDASPLEDQAVAGVTGVVTHVAYEVFFIQQDGVDDAASDGIPVTVKGFPSVSVGDLVVVDGVVDEAYGRTEIDSTQVIVVSSGNALPEAIELDLPVASMDHWETIEGMRVSLEAGLVATDVYNAAKYGEVWLADELLTTPTQTMAPGAAAAAQQDLNDRSKVLVDDNDGRRWMAINWLTDPFLRRGDVAGAVTGVVDYGFGNYRIQPSADVEFTSAGTRPAGPPTVEGQLTASAFNVLNYFTTLDTGAAVCGPDADQGCRGADTADELERQTTKIVEAITAMDVDIIGLMEIENAADNAPEQALVEALNAATAAGTYDYVAAGPVGSDAIRVGLLYKPAAVTPVGDHAILDSSVDPDFNDDKNRAVLAQTFRDAASGNTVTVAVNHLKSKGSDCDELGDPDAGDGQGNCNLTRTSAAEAERDWLAGDPTGQGSDHVLVLGDLNAYRMEDPVTAFTDHGYVDVVAEMADDTHTYVFFGAAGSLDHALANDELAEFVTGAAVWGINADESAGTDYNIEDFKKDSVYYEPDAFRSSDHDPVIVGMTLPVPPSDADLEFEDDVEAGGSLTTDIDGDGATASDPVEATVTTPNAGTVKIERLTVEPADQEIDGYSLFGYAFDIQAPDASASDPLVLTFAIDGSLLPDGVEAADIVVFRNGVAVEACASGDGIAAPDPCLASAASDGDDAVLTVLTSKASVWTFGVEVLPATGVDSLPLGLLALALLALGGLAVVAPRRRELA